MRIVDAVNKLKSGIETGNRLEIEEAYAILTGETVTFPASCSGKCGGEPPVPTESSINKLDVGELSIGEPDFTMNKSKPDKGKSRKFENTFSPDIKMDEEDGYDSIDDSVKPVARQRKPHQKVDVFCQDCRQTISVDPQFAKDPYHCDFVKLNQKCPYANE